MKAFLFILCCLVSAPLFAQTPSFKSFNTNNFKTNGLVISLSETTTNQWRIDASNIVAQSTIGATLDGFDMYPATPGATNRYWWDFGRTNSNGQRLIYGTLLATNDVLFIGPTNLSRWSIFSFNVIASGANRTMYVPDNLPHFSTNGWTHAGSGYSMILTNGNEFRMTIQSNITISTLWTTFGQ